MEAISEELCPLETEQVATSKTNEQGEDEDSGLNNTSDVGCLSSANSSAANLSSANSSFSKGSITSGSNESDAENHVTPLLNGQQAAIKKVGQGSKVRRQLLDDFQNEIRWKSTPNGAASRKEFQILSLERDPMTNNYLREETAFNPLGNEFIWPNKVDDHGAEFQWMYTEFIPADVLIYTQSCKQNMIVHEADELVDAQIAIDELEEGIDVDKLQVKMIWAISCHWVGIQTELKKLKIRTVVNLEATMGKAFELKFMLKEGSLSRLTTAQLVAELARNWEEVAHFVLALFDIVQRRRVRAYYESVFNRYPLKMAGQGVQCKRDAYAALQKGLLVDHFVRTKTKPKSLGDRTQLLKTLFNLDKELKERVPNLLEQKFVSGLDFLPSKVCNMFKPAVVIKDLLDAVVKGSYVNCPDDIPINVCALRLAHRHYFQKGSVIMGNVIVVGQKRERSNSTPIEKNEAEKTEAKKSPDKKEPENEDRYDGQPPRKRARFGAAPSWIEEAAGDDHIVFVDEFLNQDEIEQKWDDVKGITKNMMEKKAEEMTDKGEVWLTRFEFYKANGIVQVKMNLDNSVAVRAEAGEMLPVRKDLLAKDA